MKAIATVSMYDMGAARNALNQSQTARAAQGDHRGSRAAALRRSSQAARRSTPAARCIELDCERHPIQREFYDFYRTPRGEFTPVSSSPELTTHPTLTSNVKFMNFYPFNDIETISPRPMLFITGDRRTPRNSAKRPISRAGRA